MLLDLWFHHTYVPVVPGLTTSDWTIINAPKRRPIENDEALLLVMNLL